MLFVPAFLIQSPPLPRRVGKTGADSQTPRRNDARLASFIQETNVSIIVLISEASPKEVVLTVLEPIE